MGVLLGTAGSRAKGQAEWGAFFPGGIRGALGRPRLHFRHAQAIFTAAVKDRMRTPVESTPTVDFTIVKTKPSDWRD
jgi:hypothetical protein